MSEKTLNVSQLNKDVPSTIQKIASWHHDRNLVDGASDNSQFKKLFEEMIEVYMAINPGMQPGEAKNNLIALTEELHTNNRIKESDGSSLPDDIGDVNVVLINIAERNGLTVDSCLKQSYKDIKDRKGRMIDGVFVKQQDLPENQ